MLLGLIFIPNLFPECPLAPPKQLVYSQTHFFSPSPVFPLILLISVKAPAFALLAKPETKDSVFMPTQSCGFCLLCLFCLTSYSSSGVIIMNYHKVVSFREQKCIFLQFKCLEVQNQNVSKIGCFWKLWGRTVPCFSPTFWRLPAILGVLWLVYAPLQYCFRLCSDFPVSLCNLLCFI